MAAGMSWPWPPFKVTRDQLGKPAGFQVPSSPRYTGQWTAASSSLSGEIFHGDQKVDLSVATALMRPEALQHDCPAPSVERNLEAFQWDVQSKTLSLRFAWSPAVSCWGLDLPYCLA